MTMKRSLAAVRDALAEVTDAVRDLAVAVNDCPAAGGELAVIDALGAHAADTEGDVRETAGAAAAALAAEEAGDVARAARLTADAHERFSILARRVRFGLAGQGGLLEIDRLPDRRGMQWRSWSDVVLRQLEQVDHAIHRADTAFIGCWQEVVDRCAAGVSVTTNQKITLEPRKRPKHPSAM